MRGLQTRDPRDALLEEIEELVGDLEADPSKIRGETFDRLIGGLLGKIKKVGIATHGALHRASVRNTPDHDGGSRLRALWLHFPHDEGRQNFLYVTSPSPAEAGWIFSGDPLLDACNLAETYMDERHLPSPDLLLAFSLLVTGQAEAATTRATSPDALPYFIRNSDLFQGYGFHEATQTRAYMPGQSAVAHSTWKIRKPLGMPDAFVD